MKTNTELLLPETYYHIYNRGINGEDLFKSENSYLLFLKKYAIYIPPVADTFAYCLLRNHFHLLVRIKSEQEINQFVQEKYPGKIIQSFSHFISSQFAHFFNSYTQTINIKYDRTGGLFETPFRRIVVENDTYFSELIWYIHYNPQKHGFVKDFRDYPHSSYGSHLESKKTKLNREQVLDWFGDKEQYKRFHARQQRESVIRNLVIEI